MTLNSSFALNSGLQAVRGLAPGPNQLLIFVSCAQLCYLSNRYTQVAACRPCGPEPAGSL